MKKALVALSIGLIASGTLATAQDLPEKYKESGKVAIANTPNYPPMEYRDPATNKLTGLDIDLAQALAKQLGVEIEWSEIGFEQMASSLTTGRVDLIHSGMSDLPKRRDAMDFVDYMRSGAQFYTTAERGDEIKEPKDFCGKTVGMSRRTSFPDEAKKWSDATCVANGLDALDIIGTEGSSDARTQLNQGRLDGAVQGSETLPYLQSLDPGKYILVGEPFTEVFQGIGFAKDATGLRDAYAAALGVLMESGEYEAIFKDYALEGAMLKTVMINGEPIK